MRRSMKRRLAMFLVMLVGGSGIANAEPGKGSFMTVRGERFIDPQGRQILLHGVSVINKSKSDGYQSWHGPEEFAALREWGMNCIRLGILWDGVEPEPGRYDEAYLAQVDKRIAWAKAEGVYVFLDMHQDLYSVLYSDGAPKWATLTEDKPHVHKGSVWSDAYLTSPAVQTALDNFWANKEGPGGVGIQDRFARMWQHVAKRYAKEPTVLGYDLFNEPNAGSLNKEAQERMAEGFAKAVARKDGGPLIPTEKVLEQWTDKEGRSKLVERLGDMDIYVPTIDAAQPVFAEFERTKVTPMFQRVADAIRKVDRSHILFLETSMSANMGMHSAIEPVLGRGGKRDPLQAYAPHGYDIVVDTPDLAHGSNERLGLIFSRHGDVAARLKMPMLVGEWGAYGSAGPEILREGRFLMRQFEELLCSDTYWDYGRGIQSKAYFEVLNRAIPSRIAGTLLAYGQNPETGKFVCTWREDPRVTDASHIYLPQRVYPGREGVKLSPVGKGFEVRPAREGGKSVHLVIPPTGDRAERQLIVSRQ